MGKFNITGKFKITFSFISKLQQRDIHLLQSNTILKQLNRVVTKEAHINQLKNEVQYCRIEEQLQTQYVQDKIKAIENRFKLEVCSDIPNAFWSRKQHIVQLPYEKDFKESNIPTKARPIQMNQELLEFCKKEIQELLDKKLIRPSKSPWSCSAFYVNNQAEKERGVPRLVINYKPLNKVLQWIRYPIPNKKDLLNRLYDSKIFSKFDMKSGFWQIQIAEQDRYKTGFNVPFGHYEWNVMPFGLKKIPSSFHNIPDEEITETLRQEVPDEQFCQVIDRISFQKWYCMIRLEIGKGFKTNIIALLDSGADQNCLREGIIPSKFYEKTTEQLLYL